MKKTLVTVIQYVVFLGLGIWIIYHMLHQLTAGQRESLVSAIKSVHVWYLLPIFVACFFSHFFRALRWRLLLETIGVKPSIPNTTFAVLVGYIANLALPRAGEIAKCTVLARYEKLPAHKMVGTIVAERAFDICCLIVISIFAVLMEAHVIGHVAANFMAHIGAAIHRHTTTLLIILAVLIALIIFLVQFYRHHRDNRIGRFMKEMSHGVTSIIHMKKRGWFTLYTVLMWICYLSQIYIGFKAFPATNHLSIFVALLVLVYGSLGLIITPGGIGAYTLLVAQMLTYYAIDDVHAQAFGWIAWAIQTGYIFILGILSLIILPIYNHSRDAKTGLDTGKDIDHRVSGTPL
ncbi:MAG: flippase-like domain-containing protein [Taibaiella sp.]|nr:flippase-like domain-containing protein [Taibaiella sp.]